MNMKNAKMVLVCLCSILGLATAGCQPVGSVVWVDSLANPGVYCLRRVCMRMPSFTQNTYYQTSQAPCPPGWPTPAPTPAPTAPPLTKGDVATETGKGEGPGGAAMGPAAGPLNKADDQDSAPVATCKLTSMHESASDSETKTEPEPEPEPDLGEEDPEDATDPSEEDEEHGPDHSPAQPALDASAYTSSELNRNSCLSPDTDIPIETEAECTEAAEAVYNSPYSLHNPSWGLRPSGCYHDPASGNTHFNPAKVVAADGKKVSSAVAQALVICKKAPGGDRARRSRGRRADDAWGYCCEGQGVCRQGPGCTGSVNSCLADPDCAPVKRPGRGPTFVVAPPVSSPINAADDASKGAAEDAVVGDGWEGDVQGRNGDDGCSACSCNGGLLTCSDIECRSPGVSVFDAEEHCNRAADRCMAIDDNAEACDAFKPCIDLWMLAGRLKFLEVPTACGCAIPEEEKDDNDCNDEWICEKMDFTTCRCFEPEGSEDVNAGCAAQNDHTGDAVCGWNADTEQCSGCPMLPEGDCKSSANPNCEWKKTVCGVVDDFTMTSPPFDSDGNKCV